MALFRKYWLACLLLTLSLASILTYQFIGGEVNEEGILREPFALIPLSLLFLLSGLTALLVKMFDRKQ